MLALLVPTCKNAVAQQPSSPDRPSAQPHFAEPALGLADTFFRFRVGNRWTYQFRGEEAVGTGQNIRTVKFQGEYSETVIAVRDFGSNVHLVQLSRDGDLSGWAICEDEEKSQGHVDFWFVVGRFHIYSKCSSDEATELASALSKSTAQNDSENAPEFVLPFRVGASWGADPEQPKRADRFYQWNVESRHAVTLPAGSFQTCYELTYRTLPDHQERLVCSGVGLATFEYTHNGTTIHYRFELKAFARKGVR